MTEIASESGHFYYKDGSPCYEVPNKSKPGEMRPTTLRDAKSLGIYPSVTEIIKMLPKPGLDSWKTEQAIMASLTLPREQNEPDKQYIYRIIQDAKEQARKAAEKGTAIHGAIERKLQDREIDVSYDIFANSALSSLNDYLQEGFSVYNLCEPEKSFAHPLGYGGKVDLHSRELGFICDFKTKEFDDPNKIKAWDEQKIQLAAYRKGLDMPEGTRLLNVFISTSKPGLVKVVEHDLKEEAHYWKIFESLFNTWKLIKRYEPK
jgi:hypothetical protein